MQPVANVTGPDRRSLFSGLQREPTLSSGMDGTFRFTNVPFNPYHMTVMAKGCFGALFTRRGSTLGGSGQCASRA